MSSPAERTDPLAGIPCDGGAAMIRRVQRINHRGQVWCYRCEQYLSSSAFAPPRQYPSWSRPRFWSYCRECTQAIDRERYAARNATPAGHQRDLEKRYQRKHRQRSREWSDRRTFAAFAIRQIRKRGLTKSEISRLAGISLATILKFERQERQRPDPQSVRRIEVLYEAVMDWPMQPEPAYRRRLPHPRYADLLQYMTPRVQRFPVRSRWKDRHAL